MTTAGRQDGIEDQGNQAEHAAIEEQSVEQTEPRSVDEVEQAEQGDSAAPDEGHLGDQTEGEWPPPPAAGGDGPRGRRNERGIVEEPDEVPEPDLDDPDGDETRFPIEPWMVNLLILLSVVVLIAVNVAAWRWVVRTPEAGEKGDWTQLLSIKRSLTGFAMFLLGGFLGFTAQKGATERAKGKARKNRESARTQNEVAKRNRDKVRRNKNVAQDRGERLRVIHGKTLNTLSRAQSTKPRRSRLLAGTDSIEFFEGETVNLTRFDSGRFVVDSPDDELRQQLLEIAELAGGDW